MLYTDKSPLYMDVTLSDEDEAGLRAVSDWLSAECVKKSDDFYKAYDPESTTSDHPAVWTTHVKDVLYTSQYGNTSAQIQVRGWAPHIAGLVLSKDNTNVVEDARFRQVPFTTQIDPKWTSFYVSLPSTGGWSSAIDDHHVTPDIVAKGARVDMFVRLTSVSFNVKDGTPVLYPNFEAVSIFRTEAPVDIKEERESARADHSAELAAMDTTE